MRRPLAVLAVLGVAAALGVAAGCGGDDESDTTTDVTTEVEPTVTEDEATTVTEDETTAETVTQAAGDVAAGQTFFAATCTTCHLGDGTQAGGIGPQLSGMDLTEERIRDQVVNGGGAMPPGLASGTDLDNVVAYVASLQ